MTSLAAALALMLPCRKLFWEVNQIIVTHFSQVIDQFSTKPGTETGLFHIHVGASFTANGNTTVIAGILHRDCLQVLQNRTLSALQLAQHYIFCYFLSSTDVSTATYHVVQK